MGLGLSQHLASPLFSIAACSLHETRGLAVLATQLDFFGRQLSCHVLHQPLHVGHPILHQLLSIPENTFFSTRTHSK